MAEPDLPEGFDVTDPDIYAERVPYEEFAELRRTAPIWWNPQPRDVGGFDDDGFWVVSKLNEVKEVSKRSDVFSSYENTAVPRFADDIPRENIELQRSKARLARAQDLARMGSFDWRRGDHALWMQPEALRVFGLPPVERVGMRRLLRMVRTDGSWM